NRDFSDIRAIMLGMGYAMMGTATASGPKAAVEAARQAISSALMEEGGVKGARGVLINITASNKLSLYEVNEACTLIRKATENDDVQINFGVVMGEGMEDKVKVTVIATGFERENLPVIKRAGARTTASSEPPRVAAAAASLAASLSVPTPPAESAAPEPAAAAPEHPAAPPDPATEAPIALDDLDVPAFLQRDRRYYQ
ncbi:MAG: cell division protein FtsZ, partial [Acidobacteriota bacterium]|nr:cell division protein FtsZ [Acidobacteriota bacterium]